MMGRGGIESKHVIQDVDKCLMADFSVFESNGPAGDGFGNRTGRRVKDFWTTKQNRGGTTKRGQGIVYAGDLSFHTQLNGIMEEENRRWHKILCSKTEVKPKQRDSI